MIKTESLDEAINAYYDDEMRENEVLNFEARMALSKYVREYTNDRCFEFYKISTSINRIKQRLSRLLGL